MDPQTEQDVLATGKNDCQTSRRPLDQTRLKVEPSDQPREGKTTSVHTYNQSARRQQRFHERHVLALCGLRLTWDSMEGDVVSTRRQLANETSRPPTEPTASDTHMTEAHVDDCADDCEDDTLLILSQLIEKNKQHTNKTTNSAPATLFHRE